MEENENQNKLRPVNDSNSTPLLPIENLIHVIRGQQVMIDSDLAYTARRSEKVDDSFHKQSELQVHRGHDIGCGLG